MRKLAVVLAALAVLSASSVAMAGVVMVQREEMTGAGHNSKVERTIMIEGNKERMTSGNRVVITDLDKGVIYIIDPQHKAYVEMQFPPKHTGMTRKRAFHGAAFKKTGKTRVIAGHKCEEYRSSGKFEMGEYTVNECISSKVPGAADFIAFEKKMKEKLKGSAFDTSEGRKAPEGVPLAQDAVTRVTNFKFPNMTAKEAEKLKKELQGHPPIESKVEVVKISEEKLPASAFEIPAGFKKQEIRPRRLHMPMNGSHGGAKK